MQQTDLDEGRLREFIFLFFFLLRYMLQKMMQPKEIDEAIFAFQIMNL